MEKVIKDRVMVGRKNQDEDIKAVVRVNQAAALQAPIFAAVITSQSVGHGLFFVMISIQAVRAQNTEWLLSHKQIQCHCLSQNSPQRAVSAACYHAGMRV